MKQILAQVLENLDEILDRYDEAAQELLEVARLDGHFDGRDPDALRWPRSARPGEPVDLADLEARAELIQTIYAGTPPRRDRRLLEAFERYGRVLPAYHTANRIFLQVQRQFLSRQLGDEADFLQLYQSVYLEALSRENPIPLDEAEAALVEFRVARAPLSHAQSVAEKLQTEPDTADPRWTHRYTYDVGGGPREDTLREILLGVAVNVVDVLAAGEHLAIRYNTFSNFVWFGVSVWRAVSDIELLLARLQGMVARRWLRKLENSLRLAQAMMLKFLQAHLEDPAQIRPKDYWYGQEYSYLTRDLVDLIRGLIDGANKLRRRARGIDVDAVPPIAGLSILEGDAAGRFLEFAHVGRRGEISRWQRAGRLASWVRIFRERARRTVALKRAEPDGRKRRSAAWKNAVDWSRRTLDLFDIDVRIIIDTEFAAVAADMDLSNTARRIVFFPTHQSLMDHPVMQHVLVAPELLEAMGWREPVACCMLARSGLMDPCSIPIGSRRISLLGVSSKTADQLVKDVDGYVIINRGDDSARPAAEFAKVLDDRPGVAYGAGTTSAFDLQVLPMQHALLAYLPDDVVIIPIAMRGIHSLWPKCPKGNAHINSGVVEVVVSPPMLGETTLLPRRRALRTQLEPATLFQAVHLATLLDPEPQNRLS